MDHTGSPIMDHRRENFDSMFSERTKPSHEMITNSGWKMYSTSPKENTRSRSKGPRWSEDSNRHDKDIKTLDKHVVYLTDQNNKLNHTIDSLRRENVQLRASYEKSEYQRNSLNGVLQRLKDDVKAKDAQVKKQNEYVKKLEAQLLKGSLHLNVYEENTKLKDQIHSFQAELRECQDSKYQLDVLLQKCNREQDMLRSALEINLIEYHEKFGGEKGNIDDILKRVEINENNEQLEQEVLHLRNENEEQRHSIASMKDALEKQTVVYEKQRVELESYSNALEMSHHETTKLQENLYELKNKNSQQLLTIQELQREIEQNNSLIKMEGVRYENTRQKLERVSAEHTKLLERFETLMKENNKFRTEYNELSVMYRELEDEIKKVHSENMNHEQLDHLREEFNQKLKENDALHSENENLKIELIKTSKQSKDLSGRFLKLETVISKQQELLSSCGMFFKSSDFVNLLEDNEKKHKEKAELKFNIHKIVEGCIRKITEPANNS